MRLSSAPGSSSGSCKRGRSGSRLRKKHKRLDAICESEYKRNHIELNGDGDGDDTLGADTELRRSSRVRKAPVLLDVSPQPPKKRRRFGKNGTLGGDKNVKSSQRINQNSSGVETLGSWRTRLRTRGKNVGFMVKEEMEPTSGERKDFEDTGEIMDHDKVVVMVDEKKEETEGEIPIILKSKRLGRRKATMNLGRWKNDNGSSRNLDDKKSEEAEPMQNDGEETASVLETEMCGGLLTEMEYENATLAVEQVEGETSKSLQLGQCKGNDNLKLTEHEEKQVEQLNCVHDVRNGSDDVEAVAILTDQAGKEGCVDGKDAIDEKTLEHENAMEVEKPKHASKGTLGQPRIKEGRRCGLCGGGTDGKPPKKLVEDLGESENEAYSGSSASEEPNYDIWDGFGDEPGWLGRLLGPINDRYGIAGIWVHQHCAVWSPEVYFAGLGCLKNVRAALCRGRALKCTRCGRRGATIGCRVDRCPKTYHLPCARDNGCTFDHRKFLIACTDHGHLFQPHGNQFLARVKKLKARKMKLEFRKFSNDARRKDVEAEEKWLENCGEDEEFLKRESKRLHRDLLRIAPVYIGGSDFDSEKLFQGWESVAGLKDVIRCMKEVVILPLLYPEFFDNLGLTPPRGVLLHGYPGTGKTLVVRSLIGACARGDKRIAYFARKGADCLGKYVGDAERQLRLLFQVAERCQPSIIFFDEIDGLAPSRTRQQDQTHCSVVSTLLALLDGLKPRGSVVVIGATNRPEAVDPALRRPGRFDREIYFPLPSVDDRAAILSLHTQRWPKPITGSLLRWISKRTAGFAGADLQALCTQAAINALKRNFPLQEVLSAAGKKAFDGKRLPLPAFAVAERDWLEALQRSPPPCSRREAGNAANDVVCSPLPIHLVPCLLRPLSSLVVSLYLDERLWLPPSMSKAAEIIKNVMVSALDKKKVSVDHWWFHVDNLLRDADVAFELERKFSYSGILLGDDSSAGSHGFGDDTDDNTAKSEPCMKHNGVTHTSLWRNISSSSTQKLGFRILVAGNPRSGQRHLASCLLHCFVGNIEIQKVDLATMSQEGRGDAVQGITEILIKCASVGSCVVFMPRIDLWALETLLLQDTENSDICSKNYLFPEMEESCASHSQFVEKENDLRPGKSKSAEVTEGQLAIKKASLAWISFIEQVETLGVSTSLVIVATSEVPYPELPHRIRAFFKTDGSSCSQLTPSKNTAPRFSVQIDENFDHDMLINLSAEKLSRDIVEQLVQLIHQRSHIHTVPCKGYRTYDSIEHCTDAECPKTDNGSANEHVNQTQPPDDSLAKVPFPPSTRSLKGKSSLLSAISTLGYQILRYPHFAELCLVTSKLKEGPSADINGPWKGWPFNSCIIRPNNSLDKVAATCSSGNSKSKEKSGLVRGLIAVGLLAYRGAYTSVREVALEIRKVLEVLVDQINTKVQAGKDRYQYLRVLSQVAYLEDMVTSWAYSLQSLERDAPAIMAKPTLPNMGSQNHPNSCEDKQVQNEDCQSIVPMEYCSHNQDVLEGSLQGIAAENPECLDLSNKSVDLNYLSSDGICATSEGHPQNLSFQDKLTNNADASLSVNEILNQENGAVSELSGTAGIIDVEGRDFGSSKPNGFACMESVALCENGFTNSCKLDGVEIVNSRPISNQVRSLSVTEPDIKLSGNTGAHENTMDSFVSCETCVSAESGVICSYHCCSECLYILHGLTQKILVHKWGLNRSAWTIEDVHDIVASLSVDLVSAVRKACIAESFGDSPSRDQREEKHRMSFECPNLQTCRPRNSGRIILPAECASHSTSQHVAAREDTIPCKPPKLDLKFIFRDGILVHVDPDKNASYHCKFETVCLCSLIELIVMMKHPFD
ncbi:Atpase family aaa domain-containing protein [Quillaja saponaria]|uniref:Atpase family aaa domain-containing protein n=1 Tax=Quillaja saponaria TaxID=32244 RepID=A0AAD7KZD2_QUISA|nr:Atpase family aaa domain-containing protein [Quillaja saponaria]